MFSNVPVVVDDTVQPDPVHMPTGAVVRLIGTTVPATAPPSVAKDKPTIANNRNIKLSSSGSMPSLHLDTTMHRLFNAISKGALHLINGPVLPSNPGAAILRIGN